MIRKANEFFTLRSSLFTYLIADTGNLGTQCVEAVFDVLISTVYLCDIGDTAGSVGAHGCYQQGDSGTDIRTRHSACTERELMVVTYHHGTMRVAKDDLSTHVDELVYKEEPALKHLLVNQHRTLGLRADHQQDAQQVGCETGPRRRDGSRTSSDGRGRYREPG